jgi:hypothetical protein
MGVVLFQMLTGAPPFEGETSEEIVSRHLQEPVPVDSLKRDRVPAWLSDIIVACLAKRADDRLPSAQAVLDAIRARGLTEEQRQRHEEMRETRALPASRRRPWRRQLTIAGAVLAVVGTSWVAMHPTAEPPPPPVDTAFLKSAALSASLVVENRLAQPIAFSMGDTDRTLAPGDTMRLPVEEGRPLDAHWAMVQPAFGGRLLGMELEGAISADAVVGELRQVVDAGLSDTLRFAPTVVNRTRRPLSVTVVGERDTTDCRCTILPGDSLQLGYYLYSPRSVVRIRDNRGATARFDALGDRTDELSGAVSITVRPEDFRSR